MTSENKQAAAGFRNIFFIGLTSFFTDLSTEMVAPLVTIYLSSFASVAIIGVIEGISESLTSILKSYSGYIGDQFSNKKVLAFLGYFSTIIYKILLFLSFSWVGVLIAKLVERTGKGIRTAPRDALVAQSAPEELGKAFGFHKMMDMLGSAVGIIVSILLIGIFVDSSSGNLDTNGFKTIFLLSIIPALFGLASLLLVKEIRHQRHELKKFSLQGLKLNKQLIMYLLVILLFSIGNSSNAFLVLRVKSVGFTTMDVLLLYLVYNLVSSAVSYPLGKLSDKIERKRLIIPAYFLYSLTYIGIALTGNLIFLYVLFGIYGIYQAIIAGSEKAYIAEIAPKDLKGTVLGLYGTAQGFGLLIASFVAGWIWMSVSEEMTFIFGAAMSLIAMILLIFVFRMKSEKI